MPSSIAPQSRKPTEVDPLDVRSHPFLAILRVMSPLSLSRDLSNADFFSRPLSGSWKDYLDSRRGCHTRHGFCRAAIYFGLSRLKKS